MLNRCRISHKGSLGNVAETCADIFKGEIGGCHPQKYITVSITIECMIDHPKKIVPQNNNNQTHESLYVLPPNLYLNAPDRPDQLSTGDREALSTMIAGYSFTPHIYDLMRFISALNSTIQAYLVKRNKYSNYVGVFRDITQEITNARISLDSPGDHGRAAARLYAVETALKIIAEREGLTQTGANMYDGKMPFAPVANPGLAEGDPYDL